MLKSKKGQIIELIPYGLIILLVAILFLVAVFSINAIRDGFNTSNILTGDINVQFNNNADRFPSTFDAAFAMMTALSAMVLIASLYFIDTALIFFIFSLPVFIFMIAGNAIFANALNAIGTSPGLSNTYSNFPMMRFFAEHWVAIIVVIGFASLVSFFGGRSVK